MSGSVFRRLMAAFESEWMWRPLAGAAGLLCELSVCRDALAGLGRLPAQPSSCGAERPCSSRCALRLQTSRSGALTTSVVP